MSSYTDASVAIFDGDDTLWRTEVLYDRARDAVRDLVSILGVDPNRWEARQRIIDVESVPEFGFSSSRFPTSCLKAFQELREGTGNHDEILLGKIVETAQSVFRSRPELVPHVTEVLDALRNRSIRLALLTKGDLAVQTDRVEQSGLASFFDAIEIVPDKSPEIIERVLSTLEVSASRAWMIGNSLKSDIVPAIKSGLRAIWVDAPVWEYEREVIAEPEGLFYKVNDLREILNIINPC